MQDYKFIKIIHDDLNNDVLKKIHSLLAQLRKDLSFEKFVKIYSDAYATSAYEIVVLQLGCDYVGLMGFRILHDFIHGKHLYIDDLVVDESLRSSGLGAKFLIYAEGLAKSLGCDNLRLCTGIDNERGKSFYLNNNWRLRAVVYKKKLGLKSPLSNFYRRTTVY